MMRALIVRFSAIGDCVMAVPVAAAIRREMPDAEIWWAVERRCEAVVDDKRLVNHKALFDRNRWKRHPGPAVWREQLLTYAGLRHAHFDIGIDLQGHSKSALALRIAAPKRRIAAQGFDALARKLNPVVPGDRTKMHTVEWDLQCLTQLGIPAGAPQWTMPELTEERAFLSQQITPGKPLATINVATGWPDKNYPVERWAEAGKYLLGKGFQVAFVGGPGEASPTVPGTLDLVGKLTLAQSMAAVAMSRLHLAGDTGTGHIAAAYGTPIISVFGPSRPEMFRPYSSTGVVLRDWETERTDDVPLSMVIEAIDLELQRS